jgi:hypothetical protein
VWFNITNDDYIHDDEAEYMVLDQTEMSFTEMINKIKASEQAKRKLQVRSYHLYRLTPEQVTHLTEERERYCKATGWDPGYSLRFTPPEIPTVTAIDPQTQADSDNTVEINITGMINPIVAHYEINLTDMEIWKTITSRDITNYYPSL